jgi:hypothetical protein
MDSYDTLKNRAVELQLAGDEVRAGQVAAQARAQLKYEQLRDQAVAAQLTGDETAAQDLAEQAKASIAPFEKSVFQDLGQGIGAGVINIGQGLVEFGAMGVDAALDTSYRREVTEFFEDGKEYLNFTPTGTAGKVAEGIVTFGSAAIPVVGWLGRANAVARGAKVVPGASKFSRSAEAFGKSKVGKTMLGNRLKLAGSTALATGAADVFVAPTTFNTVSDSFDALPDFLKTEKDTGLTGSEDAFRTLRNKFRFGVEGVLAGAAVEAAMPVVGAALRAPAYIPGVPKAAAVITRGFDRVAEKMSGGTLQKYFSSAGLLPKEIYEGMEDVRGFVDATTRDAAKRFQAFDKAAKKVTTKSKLFGRGKEGIDTAYNDLQSFLIGTMKEPAFLKKYNGEVLAAAKDMRSQVDGLTDIFMRSVEDMPNSVFGVDPKAAADAKAAMVKQFSDEQGKYLRRMYEKHLNPEEFVVDMRLYDKAVNEIAASLSKTSRQSPEEIRQAATKVVNDALGKQTLEGGQNVDEALKVITQGQKKANKGPNGQPVPLFRIAQGMLKDRTIPKEAKSLREMLGEITDPKQLYYRTVADMAETIAANQFYRGYANTSMKNFDELAAGMARPLAINGRSVTPSEQALLEQSGYVRLGELTTDANLKEMTPAQRAFGGKYGALTGSYVPAEIADSLTIASRTQSPTEELLALALQAKGLSQMSKTVLNPLSLIRNFHSGIFMIGANGNVGRDMNLMESARLTMGRLTDMADDEFRNIFNMLQKAGIVDQNYVVNEFKELLKEGADLKVAGKVSDVGTKLINSVPFVQPLVKGAQNVYSGTDNFWKTVGYSGEKAKYTNAIRRGLQGTEATIDDVAEEFTRSGLAARTSDVMRDMDFLDVLSTDIVKSTMPTYSRVPESIKMLRRIPFIGNFMAFPAEILRTTTNITRQGLRELSFKVDPNSALFKKLGEKNARILERQVRAIGAKRLSSYVGMAYATPLAIQKAAMELTDFSEKQMDALKRMIPYFMKGNIVAPIQNREVNGKPEVDYVDLTYMMPYDFMLAPARAGLQAYSETGTISDSQLRQISAGMQAALSKFSEPFLAEGLLSERIADVTLRNGETKTGARIFVEKEDPLDRATKGILHVLGGFTPGAVEMFARERRGEIEEGRVLKAITGNVDRYGTEFSSVGEAASIMTGFREMKTDLSNKFYYAGAEYTTARNALTGDFTSFARRNDVTQEQIAQKYADANKALLEAQAELYEDIQAAKTLGLSQEQIVTQLSRDAKMGGEELGMLLSGQFRPITISNQLIESILMETQVKGQRRVAETLPVEQLVEQYSNLIGTSVPIQERQQAPSQPSAIGSVASAVQGVTGSIADTYRSVAPSILGGDPAAQSANEEILRRQQQGQ